ncbi:MAG TPA: DUF1657 domain-containing protein [Pseudoneobacillus sp.]|nr:DUF1657 domain-containing protein [Pseudoneobacillus sp.]
MTIAANVNQCVATIKGIEAQLSILALNSEEESAQRAFHEVMGEMEKIRNELQNRVTQIELEEPQYKNS